MDRTDRNMSILAPMATGNEVLTSKAMITQALHNAPWQRSHWQISRPDMPQLAPVETTLVRVETARLVFSCLAEVKLEPFLAAPEVIFMTTLSQPPLRFEASSMQRRPWGQGQTLVVPWPQRLQMLRQRSTFRVPVGALTPLVCHLTSAGGQVALEIADISDGGVSLLDTDGRLSDAAEGVVYRDGQLDLQELGRATVTLRVTHVQHVVIDGRPASRVGCTYVGLDDATRHLIGQAVLGFQQEVIMRSRRVP